MTRILMFCSQFHPIVGGAERQAGNLARALLRRGCEVAVLTPRRDPSWPLEEEVAGVRVHRYPFPDLTHRLPGVRGLGIPNLLVQGRLTARAARRHLGGYELLHVHMASNLVPSALAVAHRMGRPVLCKVACGGERFDFRKIRATTVLSPRLIRRLVEGIDRWVAVSREIRNDLQAAGVPSERIVSIPNGVDPNLMPLREPPVRPRRFLYLGRLRKCDFGTLFDAFARLRASVPEAELRMVGAGGDAEVAKALSRHPSAAERTELISFLPAREALAWADALVLPTRAEGVSNALLEAMAAGVPCVASDIPPNREVLDGGRCGLLVPLGEPDALASALRRVVERPELLVGSTEAARARIEEHYAFDVVADRYLDLYGSLLAAPADPLGTRPSTA